MSSLAARRGQLNRWGAKPRMPKRILAALSVMLAVNSLTVAAQRKRLPRFDDYRVAGARNETGKIIGMDRGDIGKEKQFRGRLRTAAKSVPNFAGHLAIVGVSCGMICLNLFVVDVRTNRIYDLPFVGIADGPCPENFYNGSRILADFRPNSRLLVLRGSTEEWGSDGVQDQPCSTRYYVWRHNRLVLLRKFVAH